MEKAKGGQLNWPPNNKNKHDENNRSPAEAGLLIITRWLKLSKAQFQEASVDLAFKS